MALPLEGARGGKIHPFELGESRQFYIQLISTGTLKFKKNEIQSKNNACNLCYNFNLFSFRYRTGSGKAGSTICQTGIQDARKDNIS